MSVKEKERIWCMMHAPPSKSYIRSLFSSEGVIFPFICEQFIIYVNTLFQENSLPVVIIIFDFFLNSNSCSKNENLWKEFENIILSFMSKLVEWYRLAIKRSWVLSLIGDASESVAKLLFKTLLYAVAILATFMLIYTSCEQVGNYLFTLLFFYSWEIKIRNTTVR